MARMTPNHDAVVVRLVYDGPPRSGKTTSVGALAEGMGRTVYSPEASPEGRTLFFDWLEFAGGSFKGVPIHCQIVTVPGQEELASRRHALLAEADAVVFVLNGVPGQMAEAASHLRSLKATLDSQGAPRPGIVVQANHRDRPDALALPELQEELNLDGIALVESVATANQGIREAFVLSVRLALDRVRELEKEGRLPVGPGEEDTSSALFAALKALEGESVSAPVPLQAGEPAVSDPPAIPGGAPRLPDSSVGIGRVWPPIDGRIVLHSATSQIGPGLEPRRAKDGSWRCRWDGWHFHSAPQHEFEQIDDARQELLIWAQQQIPGLPRLSPQRCIVLAETGWGTTRLWQIVRSRQSLHQRLRLALPGDSAAAADEAIRACIALLLEARESFRSAPPLPCQLDVISELEGRPVYCGLLPLPGWTPAHELLHLPDAELVRREIQPLIEAAGGHRHWQEELVGRSAG